MSLFFGSLLIRLRGCLHLFTLPFLLLRLFMVIEAMKINEIVLTRWASCVPLRLFFMGFLTTEPTAVVMESPTITKVSLKGK
jgi:hypothetical protein